MKVNFKGRYVDVKITNRHDHIQRYWLKGRFYETGNGQLLNWVHANVPHRTTVIDVGANIGNHTLFMQTMMGCKSIWFEPSKENAVHLMHNLTLNNQPSNGHIMGLGDENKDMSTHIKDPNNCGMITLHDQGDGEKVQVMRFDDMYKKPMQVSYIKLDCEGMEQQALRGMEKTLRAQKKTYVSCECITDAERRDINKILTEYGYKQIPGLKLNHTPTYIWQK